MKNIFSKILFNRETSEFKDTYSLSCQNILAHINIVNKNYSIAKEVWSKAIENLKLFHLQKNDKDVFNL